MALGAPEVYSALALIFGVSSWLPRGRRRVPTLMGVGSLSHFCLAECGGVFFSVVSRC